MDSELSDNGTDWLVAAAARGDRAAAGEFFRQHLTLLSAVARRIAGNTMDADDLLSEAMFAVLAKWAQGEGPTQFATAYIAQAMRNRVRDERRSPRSRVVPLDEADEVAADTPARVARTELHREIALVRAAMQLLPHDQQAVLTATVVEGKKPGELEGELGRAASAIYSLSRRARANLKRSVLILMLTENAPDECRAASRQLPSVVKDSPRQSGLLDDENHYQTCRRCRRTWRAFAAMSTGLSIAALAIVGDLVAATPTATATADTLPEDSTTNGPSLRLRSVGTPHEMSTLTPPMTGSTAAARLAEFAPAGADSSGASSMQPAAARAKARKTTLLLQASGVTLIATGTGLLGLVGFLFATQQAWFTPPPTAALNVTRVDDTTSQTQFIVDFDVQGQRWTIDSFMLTFKESIINVVPPQGWDCHVGTHVAVCATAQENDRGGEFHLTHADNVRLNTYEFVLSATTPLGAEIVGTVMNGG